MHTGETRGQTVLYSVHSSMICEPLAHVSADSSHFPSAQSLQHKQGAVKDVLPCHCKVLKASHDEIKAYVHHLQAKETRAAAASCSYLTLVTEAGVWLLEARALLST